MPDSLLPVNRGHSIYMYIGFDLSGNQQLGFSLVLCDDVCERYDTAGRVRCQPGVGIDRYASQREGRDQFSEPVSDQSLANVRLLSNGNTPVVVTRTLSDTNRW